MHTGVCYFPEHWPRERWADDIERMAEAGIEYVRMAEFAWNRMEPNPGEYDFEWLETAVGLIGEHDMQAVLCTPTATPPKWLLDEYPEIRQKQPDGTPLEFGSRRHYCFNSAVYWRESRRIIEKLANHFAGHDHVAGWQTDNEYGCHETVRCYCEDCASAFRDWLREHYDSIDDLNEAWGNAFWSQEYRSFSEVDLPGSTAANHHPSRLLDYNRFASDSVVEYNRLHVDILREANDDWFVTHNFMGDFDPLNAFDVTEDLDFAAWDSYPTLHTQEVPDTPAPEEMGDDLQRAGDPDVTGMNHALYRGASDGPFWVMENQAGDIRAFPYSAEPDDGMIRLWTHQAAAHGADVVSYFRWRRCQFGQEQYWGALNNYDGAPDRGLEEATDAAVEFESLPDLDAPSGDVAMLVDYDSLWATHAEAHSPDFDYWAHLRAYYRALRRRGVTVDLVSTSANLGAYAALVAPSLHLVDDGLASRLVAYAENGGELLLTIRSAMKDEHDHLRDELAPGPLAETLGAHVAQHESLSPGVETQVSYDGDSYAYQTWAEWLEPADGAVIGHLESGPGTDEPAIVRNAVGDGHVEYVGVWPEVDLADAISVGLLERAGVSFGERLPERVRLTERDGYTWVTNFGTDAVTVDAGSGTLVLGEETVPGRDLAVVDVPAHELEIDLEN
ncbi:beta-galactosidase [Natronolimnobius sp. AArcel1]|uniref:beta-galactosidase n=1 Tax=Natronolimnobius sp. AArcel1 TaxID=1679093 RepID=UPI0013EB5EDB|nr:beta-galactosidase [Natronolimnobius sp. AArcel1]NGM69511.1 beta-galactosidase [Natronolimnobius sp. AArcel1]